MTESTRKSAEATAESTTPTTAEATCRRELDLEIPAEEVSKAMERVAKEFAKVARVPGFRPGKAPLTLIRRRFADDIKGEVLQSLVPERVGKSRHRAETDPRLAAACGNARFQRGPAAQIPRGLRGSAGI